MEFGTFSFTIWGVYNFLDPSTHTLVNISWNLALSVLQIWGGIKVLDPPKHTHTHTLTILAQGIKKFLDPPTHTS